MRRRAGVTAADNASSSFLRREVIAHELSAAAPAVIAHQSISNSARSSNAASTRNVAPEIANGAVSTIRGENEGNRHQLYGGAGA